MDRGIDRLDFDWQAQLFADLLIATTLKSLHFRDLASEKFELCFHSGQFSFCAIGFHLILGELAA